MQSFGNVSSSRGVLFGIVPFLVDKVSEGIEEGVQKDPGLLRPRSWPPGSSVTSPVPPVPPCPLYPSRTGVGLGYF